MSDDFLAQRAEVTGETVPVCDLCGFPIRPVSAQRVTVDPGLGERVETVRVCPQCGRVLTGDEIPFEAEVDAGLREADE